MTILDDIRRWREYRQTVAQLQRLSDRQLNDVGLSRDGITLAARRGR